jgi:predicted nucleotide-binding protein (sugar kinase/HSP70/actin superfamily)
LLEFDEHRGEAGLVTRIEAFIDEIETHRRKNAAGAARGMSPQLGHPSPLAGAV